MPLWGWIILGIIAAAIMIPIKIKILKKILNKSNDDREEEESL